MGNLLDAPQARPGRLLEFRCSCPDVDALLGDGGLACTLFAEISILGAAGSATRIGWDQAVPVRIPSDASAVVVSIFAVTPDIHQVGTLPPRFVAETCIPYGSQGGLADLGIAHSNGATGPALALRLALSPGVRVSQAPREKISEVFRRAQRQYRKDGPFLAMSVRELSLQEQHKGQLMGDRGTKRYPLTKREAIALELETAALEAMWRSLQQSRGLGQLGPGLGGLGSESGREPDAEPENMQTSTVSNQLRRVQEENQKLKDQMPTAREHSRAGKSSLAEAAARDPLKWGRTLQVMQSELENCRARQRKICEEYEQRVASLQAQVRQASALAEEAESAAAAQAAMAPSSALALPAPGGPLADDDAAGAAGAVRTRLGEAGKRRDALKQQLQDARAGLEALQKSGDAASFLAVLGDNLEIKKLAEQGEQCKVELASLQQELAQVHEEERERGLEQQDEMRLMAQQLYEELDELHAVREDERVRRESEIRELRKERDANRDLVDDISGELSRLRAKAEALRDMGSGAPTSAASLGGYSVPPTGELVRLREENKAQAQELERLQRVEEAKKGRIGELELEQESLVEKVGVISSQAVLVEGSDGTPEGYAKALEGRAAELQSQVAEAEGACEELRAHLKSLRAATEEAHSRSERLRRDYDELQQRSDERVLRMPLGTAAKVIGDD